MVVFGTAFNTICITNYDDSPIVEYADIKLFTSTHDDKQINESLSARIAEIALIDALYIAVASKMKKQALRHFCIDTRPPGRYNIRKQKTA